MDNSRAWIERAQPPDYVSSRHGSSVKQVDGNCKAASQSNVLMAAADHSEQGFTQTYATNCAVSPD